MKIILNAGYTPSLVNFRGPLIREIIRRGYEVVCCGPEGFPEKEEEIRAMGARFRSTPVNRTGIGLAADFKYYHALKRISQQEKPDILLSYTVKPVIYGSLAAHAARVPRIFGMLTGLGYVFTGEIHWKKQILRGIVSCLLKKALSRCSGFFFQNPDDLEDIQSRNLLPSDLPIKIVNGSGVDLEHFKPEPLPDHPPARFLLIARLLADKGVREYVAAARAIRERGFDAKFHLVGGLDSNPTAITQAELDSWCDDGMIIYHGEQDDVRPFLRDCHIYVLPSYREGTPRTVLEAMATGRAIITTDAPGCRETVKNPGPADDHGIRRGANGLLIPPRDANALMTAMELLGRDAALQQQMARASRKYAGERFDVHKVNAQMLEAMNL